MSLSEAQKKEAEAALRRELARGALTEEEAQERRARFGITAAGTELPSYSDLEVLRQLRLRDGDDELAVLRDLHENGERHVTERRAEIDQHRDWLQRRDAGRVARQHAASPEGRALAAAQALDAQAHEARRVEAGKALLRSDPEAHGVSAEMIDQLNGAEVLSLSGLVQTTDPAHDPAANAASAEGSDAA